MIERRAPGRRDTWSCSLASQSDRACSCHLIVYLVNICTSDLIERCEGSQGSAWHYSLWAWLGRHPLWPRVTIATRTQTATHQPHGVKFNAIRAWTITVRDMAQTCRTTALTSFRTRWHRIQHFHSWTISHQTSAAKSPNSLTHQQTCTLLAEHRAHTAK